MVPNAFNATVWTDSESVWSSSGNSPRVMSMAGNVGMKKKTIMMKTRTAKKY